MSSDQELWAAITNDDEQAFSALFYRYSARIYNKAYSYIRDEEVCKEIVHDIFITLWGNRKTTAIDSFTAYLTSASRYRVYKYLTKVKASPIDYREDIEQYQSTIAVNEGFSKLESNDFENELNRQLVKLPLRCREIFLMSRMQHISNDDIAKKLGISKRTVENQLTYALKYLRISLKGYTVLCLIYEGISQF